MSDGRVDVQRKEKREGVSKVWVLHLISPCLGTAYVVCVRSLPLYICSRRQQQSYVFEICILLLCSTAHTCRQHRQS